MHYIGKLIARIHETQADTVECILSKILSNTKKGKTILIDNKPFAMFFNASSRKQNFDIRMTFPFSRYEIICGVSCGDGLCMA